METFVEMLPKNTINSTVEDDVISLMWLCLSTIRSVSSTVFLWSAFLLGLNAVWCDSWNSLHWEHSDFALRLTQNVSLYKMHRIILLFNCSLCCSFSPNQRENCHKAVRKSFLCSYYSPEICEALENRMLSYHLHCNSKYQTWKCGKIEIFFPNGASLIGYSLGLHV